MAVLWYWRIVCHSVAEDAKIMRYGRGGGAVGRGGGAQAGAGAQGGGAPGAGAGARRRLWRRRSGGGEGGRCKPGRERRADADAWAKAGAGGRRAGTGAGARVGPQEGGAMGPGQGRWRHGVAFRRDRGGAAGAERSGSRERSALAAISVITRDRAAPRLLIGPRVLTRRLPQASSPLGSALAQVAAPVAPSPRLPLLSSPSPPLASRSARCAVGRRLSACLLPACRRPTVPSAQACAGAPRGQRPRPQWRKRLPQIPKVKSPFRSPP
ncbi:hypothetical protein PVAP13_5KG376407 [Panicum virgatum]|uniref:Uncharacterized protein n=1 Tax=Panicum virgatum TaxID=38727 RepID=A0A8T0SJN7_PANVG|nr:hypothetical protein PVAP13_5KG376407 [Panicum virgatum]